LSDDSDDKGNASDGKCIGSGCLSHSPSVGDLPQDHIATKECAPVTHSSSVGVRKTDEPDTPHFEKEQQPSSGTTFLQQVHPPGSSKDAYDVRSLELLRSDNEAIVPSENTAGASPIPSDSSVKSVVTAAEVPYAKSKALVAWAREHDRCTHHTKDASLPEDEAQRGIVAHDLQSIGSLSRGSAGGAIQSGCTPCLSYEISTPKAIEYEISTPVPVAIDSSYVLEESMPNVLFTKNLQPASFMNHVQVHRTSPPRAIESPRNTCEKMLFPHMAKESPSYGSSSSRHAYSMGNDQARNSMTASGVNRNPHTNASAAGCTANVPAQYSRKLVAKWEVPTERRFSGRATRGMAPSEFAVPFMTSVATATSSASLLSASAGASARTTQPPVPDAKAVPASFDICSAIVHGQGVKANRVLLESRTKILDRSFAATDVVGSNAEKLVSEPKHAMSEMHYGIGLSSRRVKLDSREVRLSAWPTKEPLGTARSSIASTLPQIANSAVPLCKEAPSMPVAMPMKDDLLSEHAPVVIAGEPAAVAKMPLTAQVLPTTSDVPFGVARVPHADFADSLSDLDLVAMECSADHVEGPKVWPACDEATCQKQVSQIGASKLESSVQESDNNAVVLELSSTVPRKSNKQTQQGAKRVANCALSLMQRIFGDHGCCVKS
jgi:hypothetical protein